MTRTLPVKGWLVRHQVRQHLDHNQIPYSEDRQAYGSTFTFDATDEQWGQIQDWVKKVTG